MKCTKDSCGAEITDGAKFCSICGTKVVVTTIVKKAVCPGCNHYVLESHNFCLNCGWKVDPAIFTDKICKGVKENGEQCRVVLTLDTKFCPTCGTPTNSSDVSTEPIRTEQGTSKEFEKDNSLNTTVSVQKSAIASNDEHETKGGKEDEQLFEQEKKDLHVEKNKHSDESEPGSPEIWTPPTIVLKGSSNSSTEEIGEKTNEKQVKVPTETVMLTTEKDKLSDLNEQKEDLQETEIKEGETISQIEASLSVDTKDTRCNADGDKYFQGDGLNPNNRTTGQQISQPTENYDTGQSDTEIGRKPKSDDTENDETKPDKSTEIKANDENNSNQDKTSPVEIAAVANQSAIEMATGDLEDGEKEEKTVELSDSKRKEMIKIEHAVEGHSSICEDSEEVSCSDFVAEKQFISEEKVEIATGKNDDIQGPKRQSGNVDGIDIDNAEPKLDDNLAGLVSGEDLENGTDRVIQPLSDRQPTESQKKTAEIGLQVQTSENNLTVADDTEKQVTSESATGEKESGEIVVTGIQPETNSNNQNSEEEENKSADISEVKTSAVGSTDESLTDKNITDKEATEKSEFESSGGLSTENATKTDKTIKVMASSEHVAIDTKEKGNEKHDMENTVKTNEKSGDKIEYQPVSETRILNDPAKHNAETKDNEKPITEEKIPVDNKIEKEPNTKFETKENEVQSATKPDTTIKVMASFEHVAIDTKEKGNGKDEMENTVKTNEIESLGGESTESATKPDTAIKVMASSEHVAIDTKEKGNGKDEMENTVKTNEIESLGGESSESATKPDTTIKVMASFEHVAIDTKEKGNGKDEMENTVKTNEIESLGGESTESATKPDTTIKVMASSEHVAIDTKKKGNGKDKMENTVKTSEIESLGGESTQSATKPDTAIKVMASSEHEAIDTKEKGNGKDEIENTVKTNEIESLGGESAESATKPDTTIKVMASSEHVAIDTKKKGNGKNEMENTVKTNAGIESQTKKIVKTLENDDKSTEVQKKLVDDGTTVKVEQDKEQDEREGSIMENKENNQAETDSNDDASSCYESAAEDISDAGSGGTNSENDSEHPDQENTEDSQGQTKKESKRIGSSKKKKKQQRKLQNQQKKESENRQQKEHNDQEDQLTGENIKQEDIKAEQLTSDAHDKKDVTTSTEEQKVKSVEAVTSIKDEANITAESKTTKVETSTSEEKDEEKVEGKVLEDGQKIKTTKGKENKDISSSDDDEDNFEETESSVDDGSKVKTKGARQTDKNLKSGITKPRSNSDTKDKKDNRERTKKSGAQQTGKPRIQGHSSNRGKNETFEVIFHAILHGTFNTKGCKVYLRFGDESLGGWKDMAHEMKRVGLYENDVSLLTSVDIPRDLLNNYVYYKYCIVNLDGREIEEYVYKRESRSRSLYILPTDLKAMGDSTYHQYDGVIRGQKIAEKENTYVYVWKLWDQYQYKKYLVKDAEFSIKAFLPPLPVASESFFGVTGEEHLMLVKAVETGLFKFYIEIGGCCTDTEFRQFFKGVLYTKYVDSVMPDFHNKGNLQKIENRIKMLLNAVTAIYLVYEYSIDVHDEEKSVLCQALLPDCTSEEEGFVEIERLKASFPTSFKKMTDRLIDFVYSQTLKRSNLNWIYSMPLLHFICGQSSPWEKAKEDLRHNALTPIWWGIVSIKSNYRYEFNLDKYVKDRPIEMTTLQQVMERLVPYFEIDYLLPRTLMAALRFEQLPIVVISAPIPPDIITATLCYYLRTEKHIVKNDKKETAILECITEAIRRNNIENYNKSAQSLVYAWRSYKISADLLKEAFHRPDKLRDVVIARILENFLISLDLFIQLDDTVESEKKPTLADDYENTFETARISVKSWLKSKLSFTKKSELPGCLKAWNRILDISIPHGVVRNKFTEFIAESLHEELGLIKIHDEDLVKVYCQNKNSFCDKMLEVLTTYAFVAVEKCSRNMDRFCNELNVKQMKAFGDLLSSVFEEKIKDVDLHDTTFLLNYSLAWTPFPTYIKMYNNNIHENCLREKCKDSLTLFYQCLKHVVDTLISGNILVVNLLLVKEKQESLSTIVKEMDVDHALFIKAVELRSAEYDAYQQCERNLKQFIYLCHRCKANTEHLEDAMQRFKDDGSTQLNRICLTADIKKGIQKYRPKIIAFEVDNQILELLPEIITCSKGIFFLTMWDKYGKQVVQKLNRQLEVAEIIEHVWIPAKQEFKNLVKTLKSGDIMFREFDIICGKYAVDNLRKELKLIEGGKDEKWIGQRIDQMEKYKNLQNYGKGAEIIIEVFREFQLKGNFKPIQDIFEMTKGGQDFPMNKLKPKLMKQCAVLKNIDGKKIKCLVKFKDSKPLIDWLREKMPEGLKELKVFVDLAYISTGDDGMEIAKVTCFQSAAIGYAPLIFNLDTDCNYKDFLERCDEVWNALDSNPNLPKELESTCQQLEWLKIVEKSHGSVEVTSLAQAEAINYDGTYHIGVRKDSIHEEQQLQLSDVLELQVTEKQEGQNLHRSYSYEQLHDLQSRLMLVAGKAALGKDDVDRFLLILDSVVRLCKIYIKLLSSGCVLFTKFNIVFRCDTKNATCTFVSFGEGGNKQTIRGKMDKNNEDVSCFVPRIAKFLEQSHEKWLEFIDDKREADYILNFFTIEQMVILQQELVRLGTKDEPSDLVYTLLSVIKDDCSRKDLLDAMEEARIELEQDETESQEDNTEDNQIEANSEVAKAKFILEMMDSDYSEYLAKQALEHGVDATNIDDGIAWCIEHENDFEEEEESTQNEGDNRFIGWHTKDITLESVREKLLKELGVHGLENSVDALIDNLEKLWVIFVTSISSSVSDYLSVEHLACILRKLGDKDHKVVDRSFSICGCKEGVPNLIICPQSEMYNTVLTLYSTEDDSQLPQSDEILLCTPNTTLDMLEIFWRRALFSNVNKIYCLVNADLLDYEVSDKGEKSLERHMRNAQSKEKLYKLVVVCSIENEYKSRMVAALDKYRIPLMGFGGEAHVKAYLSKRFTVDELVDGVQPASFVDFGRSSVRVVKSWRAGVGKSLFKRNMVAALGVEMEADECVVSIPLYDKKIVVDEVMEVLLAYTNPPHIRQPRIFHIDISHEVQEGVDAFLFQLLVLGCLSHTSGNVWKKSDIDYYIVESMPLLARDSGTQAGKLKCMHRCLDILPDVLCRSPKESLEIFEENPPNDYRDSDLIFDNTEFESEAFQRTFKYLKRLDDDEDLTDINLEEPEGDKQDCLFILLRHCGVIDPSWSELYHFVSFLNRQLQDFETSTFCDPVFLDDLPGFRSFVLKFMIQMSRDFATRSLVISEESPSDMLKRQLKDEDEDEDDIEQLYEMRRTWETSPHPYLFFNPDHHTVTFLGFNIQKKTGNLIDDQTGEVLEEEIMEPTIIYDQPTLYNGLDSQPGVNLSENFDQLSRGEKIEKLCQVMGIEYPHDPDETYELTTDNVKKILAIYMRFRCDIPVIIMGETGCGKTRLIKYMCALHHFPGDPVDNMIIMKVHGGTTRHDIIQKVKKAEDIARKNTETFLRKKREENEDGEDDESKVYENHMFTVLFFDEANTTEAIGVIKEIMCDKSLGGKPIQLHERLKIVAACNPYRKHKEELVKKLEQAGLGYHVDADKTTDRLGRVPMRQLVYRVQPLPQSMLPLVWDFGQLNTRVEEMYIRQMVLRYINEERLPCETDLDDVLSKLLGACQNFMRLQQDECSFVSLRDVERVLEVMNWFYEQTKEGGLLFDEKIAFDEDIDNINITKALILALGVCYQACLKKRQDFRDMIVDFFEEPFMLLDVNQLESELIRCQEKFLDSDCVTLADNIAKNQALKENVFMMIVCIELRIPLFLVGKPGSSKSLAKTIVADAMQGDTARTSLFKKYKQVQMVSFQCSPLSTPDGILGTFRQCAEFQKAKDLEKFVSVVVLDEIGLAEDSPKMPLKTLHPLLEDGCQGDEDPEDYMKVAFIGISNWALDPAKMNRGIFVQREVPDLEELNKSAKGICRTSKDKDGVLKLIDDIIPLLSKSYLELFSEPEKTKQREFFGLRDFYSLIKMIYGFAAKTEHKPTWLQLKHAIMRNFGGVENIDPVQIFKGCLKKSVVMDEQTQDDDPDCSSGGMIQACLEGDKTNTSETRYLLLLTQNYGDLAILQQKILSMHDAVIIFGSSFPSDQEYTQVCRNINRIKVNMETGSTVILLNLENLYESLYDALNQYYVYYGGERYVDLGLGSHRVKCKVHKNFRLIVVAEKQIVYKNFPIPLINRLEKHVLSLSTMLSETQVRLSLRLEEWVKDFCHVEKYMFHQKMQRNKTIRSIGEVFIGYHADTCAAIIMQLFEDRNCTCDDSENTVCIEILKDAKTLLLWCAAPDGVMRLKSTKLREKKDELMNIYFQYQQHNSLLQYIHYQVVEERKTHLFSQVTTHSKLLSTPDLDDLSLKLHILRQNMTLLTLQSFDTEQQFCRQIRLTLEKSDGSDTLLIVQCDCGDENADLVACARYSIQGELKQTSAKHKGSVYVILIVQLPREAGHKFAGFQCGLWHSVHIDELRPPQKKMPTFIEMYNKPVSAFLEVFSIRAPIRPAAGIDHNDTDKDIDIVETEEYIDILSLILNCVQPALALVKDPENDSQRTTERIKTVLNLIQESGSNGDKSFLSGIVMHLKALLKEKEDQESELHKDWLASEASNPDHINRAGTFRRAALQCFEEKLKNLLAGVIAFIDKNRNMNILVIDQTDNWQKSLWLEILNSPKVTGLQYIDLVGQSVNSTMEYMVQGTAYEGGGFLTEMPFSWLINRHINEYLKNTSEEPLPDGQVTPSSFELVMKTANRLESTPLGELLSQIEGTFIQKAIHCYVADFVYMAYPVKSELEHNIVCENVIIGCKQLIQGEIGNIFCALVGCHKVFEMFGARFRNFSDIVHVWPECCEVVSTYKREVSEFKEDSEERKMMYLLTHDEITIDLLSLQFLLKNLEPPTKEALNKSNNRRQWIKKLCDYRPVVERVFGNFSSDAHDVDIAHSSICSKGVEEARYLWTRAIVMKLFIEHVCTEDSEVRRCMPLWKMMAKEANMKKMESMEKVEKFLKSCNKDVSSRIFEKQTCSHCSAPYKGNAKIPPSIPVTLPCSPNHHTICRKCYDESIAVGKFMCPICDHPFEKDMAPIPEYQSEDIMAYQDFRRRCNSFYMEVVSQLCFAEGTPPCDEVVEKLLSFITIQTTKGQQVTKELTVFDDCIDPTPVVRSFLLQHLIRTSGDEVNRHLEQYFRKALQLVDPSKENYSKTLDLCLLVLQCFEDSCHLRNSEENKEQIVAATDMLKNACNKLKLDKDQLLENMDHLANTRFSLAIAAKYMHKVFTESADLETRLKRLFDSVSKLFDKCGSSWPKRYFIKYLCRCYGIDSYQTIRRNCDVTIKRWINLPELQKDQIEECCDRFLVCGKQYTQMRETFVKAALNEDGKQIESLLQCKKDQWITEIRFLLVVYREVTMNFLYGEEQHQFAKVKESLQRTLMNCTEHKDLIRDIFTNSLWRHCPDRNISAEMDLSEQGLSCLLAHCQILFKKIPGQKTWLTPLTNFANHPELMVESYLPSMPQDDLEEVKGAILAARDENGLENPVFYRCPNGHLYIIGDCGRPAFSDRCKECGEEIGGEGYELKEGNIMDAGIDTTDTGHILGRARHLKAVPYPERRLNRANCAIMKFVLHIAMAIGANQNTQAVCSTIKPEIEQGEVHTYILEHMQKDLKSIATVLGKSKEDVLILIHYLLSEIMNYQTAARIGERVEDNICYLKDKRSRAIWEEKINERYIEPVLERSEEILREVTHQVLSDKRFGADPLLQLLYETDNTTEFIGNSSLCENPSVWQFRERISVNHLIQKLTRSRQKCPILTQFLDEEHFLRCIRFVPSIIKLQRILIQKYSRKISRTEASSLSMEKVLQKFRNDPGGRELEKCWTDYKQVWGNIKQSLDGYGFPVNGSILYLSKEDCHKKIDDKTVLSYILPARKEKGLCAYALLFFLLEKQNLFLQKYCSEGGTKYDRLPRVHVRDISTAHLISYHPDRDLLPMVLANCNYSFEVGQGTKVEYNFTSLERQLMDRLLFTKSVILMKDIDTALYRSETTNAVVFSSLRDKIRQERISPAVLGQIQEELRTKRLPELCDSIDYLDIAISFLKSVGCDPENPLSDFMINILKLDASFVSQKAQQSCKCKHVQSLWITLTLEKTKRLERANKESFDGVSFSFKQELSEEQSNAVHAILDNLQVEQLDFLSEIVFECILLNIDIPKKDEESVDMSKEGFKEALSTYLFDPPYVNEAPKPDWLTHLVDALPVEKKTRILCCHVVEIWVLVNESFTEKMDEI